MGKWRARCTGQRRHGSPDFDHFRGASRPNGGTSVIVAPGGGYTNLAIDKRGRQIASWCNAIGVTAFVLKYRLGPRYHHPIELRNVQREIRLVRSRAAQFDIALNKIGIIGFSAEGHLAATAGTRFNDGNPGAADSIDRARSRPDFLILAYPVICFDPAIAHAGSAEVYSEKIPRRSFLEDLSADLHVTAHTAPTFLLSTTLTPLYPPGRES